jgi:hypothetical protein
MLKNLHLGSVGLSHLAVSMIESFMSSAEKRKNLRRSIAYPAFIDRGDGSPAIECTLCDASQEGALLAVAEPSGVPDEFILALSSDGAARRRCRVAWRTEDQVGVEFLKDLKKNAPPMRMPVMRSSAPRSVDAEPAERVDIDTLAPH